MASQRNRENDKADKDAHKEAHHEAQGAVRTILEMSEERMGEVVTQLLANEAFVGVVQKAISGSLEAKRGVDKGVSTMLSLVNVPTLDDVEKVRGRLDEVEQSMAEIAERISSVTEKLSKKTSVPSTNKRG